MRPIQLIQLDGHMPMSETDARVIQMMGYILVADSGELILIDGGMSGDADYLLASLRRVGGEKPVIAAWFVTHAHRDHVDALYEILQKYPDALEIRHIYHAIPDETVFATLEKGHSLITYQHVQEIFAAHADRVTRLHGGEQFTCGTARLSVLFVPAAPYAVINDTSVVYRLDAAGQSVLFLGDLSKNKEDALLAAAGDRCKDCDFVQLAHHGQKGVSEKFYTAIRPRCALWCTPDWLWDNDDGGGFNTHIWQTVTTRGWMKKIGVTRHFVSKDGTATLTFPMDFDDPSWGTTD